MTTPKQTTEADHFVGKRIAAFRIARGMSQKELGSHLGVSFQQVQKYEKGRNRVGAGRLQAIADALSIPVADIYDTQSADIKGLFDDQRVPELVNLFNELPDDESKNAVLSLVRTAVTLRRGTRQ